MEALYKAKKQGCNNFVIGYLNSVYGSGTDSLRHPSGTIEYINTDTIVGLRVLKSTVKKKWFDMIRAGIKKEEYKEVKDFWISRLTWDYAQTNTNLDNEELISELTDIAPDCPTVEDILECYGYRLRDYDALWLFNGGALTEKYPNFIIEMNGTKVDYGLKKWGAENGRKYFCLKLGDIIK